MPIGTITVTMSGAAVSFDLRSSAHTTRYNVSLNTEALCALQGPEAFVWIDENLMTSDVTVFVYENSE